MKKPALYIITGLPFSGKTFIANKIAIHTGAKLLSYDALWLDKYKKTGRDIPYNELSQIAQDLIKQHLTDKTSIIYDTLNDTFENRQCLRSLAKLYNSDAVLIYTNTPLEIIKKRQEQNQHSKERHSVSIENFENALRAFEAPSLKEKAIEFTPTDDVFTWLEKKLQR